MADAMNPLGTHPAEVLRRALVRLRAALNVDDDQCFLVDDLRAAPPASIPDKAWALSFEGGSFNGGVDQMPTFVTLDLYFNVTAFNRLTAVDESARANSFITRYELNLFEMQRRALLALVGWRLELDDAYPVQVTSTVKATRCGKPEILQTDSGAFAAFLATTFAVGVALELCDDDYVPEY